MAERLLAMCHWKEKLEIKDYSGRRIVPSNEADALISLRPEQELLPEERERIEKEREEREGWRREARGDEPWGDDEKAAETLIDDELYQVLRRAILERRPTCLAKEGTEPGEGYPEKKIRNTSVGRLI